MRSTTTFGARLKKLRSTRYPLQKDFAAAIPVDPGYVSRIENNNQEPSEDFLMRCLELLANAPGLTTRDEVYTLADQAGFNANWVDALPKQVQKLLPPNRRYSLPPAWRSMSKESRLPRVDVLKDLLMTVRQWRGSSNPIVIWAPPGYGKRTLIDLLLEAPELKQWFPDGVLTAWMRQDSSPADWQKAWAQTARLPIDIQTHNPTTNTSHLRAHLSNHRTLMVVVDVQTLDDIEPLCVAGADSTLIITTTNIEVVNALTRYGTRGLRFEVPELTVEEARQLRNHLPHGQLGDEDLDWLTEYLHGHPLALTGAMALSRYWSGTDLQKALCDTPVATMPPDLEINLFRVWDAAHRCLTKETRAALERLAWLPQVARYTESQLGVLWKLPYTGSIRFLMEELRAYRFLEGTGDDVHVPAATWLFVRHLAAERGMNITDAERWKAFGGRYLQTAEWSVVRSTLQQEVRGASFTAWRQRIGQMIKQRGFMRREIAIRLLSAMWDDVRGIPEPAPLVLPATVAHWCLRQENIRFARTNTNWLKLTIAIFIWVHYVLWVVQFLTPDWPKFLLLISGLAGELVILGGSPLFWIRQAKEFQNELWDSLTFYLPADTGRS